MTEHAGVVRDEEGLRAGLAELAAIEKRMADVGIHPDIAGFQDLAHAFDLKSAALAARATLEAALTAVRPAAATTAATTRTETPRCRSISSGRPTAGITHESIPAIPEEISALMEEVTTDGKLAE